MKKMFNVNVIEYSKRNQTIMIALVWLHCAKTIKVILMKHGTSVASNNTHIYIQQAYNSCVLGRHIVVLPSVTLGFRSITEERFGPGTSDLVCRIDFEVSRSKVIVTMSFKKKSNF